MPGNKTFETHEALMDEMARTLGADLDEAELRGALPPEERAGLLLSCTGCSDPGGCREWLSAHGHADEAPEFCRNGDHLQALVRRLHPTSA